MVEEIIPEIVQAMIDFEKPMKLSQLASNTGFGEGELIRSINLLTQMGLIISTGEKPSSSLFSLIKELKAIHLARAAQLGVDLNSFDEHFKIDKKEKKIALEIASQAEKIKILDVKKRKPMVQKRNYFSSAKHDDVSDNLILLLEASNANLYDYLELLSKKDKHLKLLLDIHFQAEGSLRDYLGER